MDTIKSYLETMFANLPATTEVLKAKHSLICSYVIAPSYLNSTFNSFAISLNNILKIPTPFIVLKKAVQKNLLHIDSYTISLLQSFFYILFL